MANKRKEDYDEQLKEYMGVIEQEEADQNGASEDQGLKYKAKTAEEAATMDDAPSGDMDTVNDAPSGDMATVNDAPFGDMVTVNDAPSGDKATMDDAPSGVMAIVNDAPSDDKATVNDDPFGDKATMDAPSVVMATVNDARSDDKATTDDARSDDKATMDDVPFGDNQCQENNNEAVVHVKVEKWSEEAYRDDQSIQCIRRQCIQEKIGSKDDQQSQSMNKASQILKTAMAFYYKIDNYLSG